jgi:hypothetical protein
VVIGSTLTRSANPSFQKCMRWSPSGPAESFGLLKIQSRNRTTVAIESPGAMLPADGSRALRAMCTNCRRSETVISVAPKPSSAWLVFSDVIVNNNKSTNSRRDDRLPAEKARHDAYRRAQFASFNLTNALICVVGSSKAFVAACHGDCACGGRARGRGEGVARME